MDCSTRMASPLPCRLRAGFTIVELLAATAILSVILFIIFGITQQTGNAWKGAQSKIEAFQGARQAFESITRTLSQATLNTYYDYFDAAGRPARDPGFSGPHHYGRQSDLHFVSGKSLVSGQVTHAVFFQTPAGYANDSRFQDLGTLLNACGFYIMHGKEPLRPFLFGQNTVPNASADKTRFRLMQFFQPSQKLQVYASTAGRSWFSDPLQRPSPPVQQLGENIVAFVVLPRRSDADAAAGGSDLAPDYEYDSRAASLAASQGPTENQLPPLVEVILVAVDETSARRLEDEGAEPAASLFTLASKLEDDLKTLEERLRAWGMTYRVFRTIVPLRNSKWMS